MGEFWLDLGISAVLTALKQAVKNEERKVELRAAMLKIAATILAVWDNDVTFDEELYNRARLEKVKLKR